jgi:AcrR family transcriptional regulator
MAADRGRDSAADPRSVRSREALSRAILALAAEGPVTEVTITALCERAGVTRRTFYNHSDSPVALLKQVLTAELDVVGDRMRADTAEPDADLTTAVRHSFGAMIGHVRRHRSIYRDAKTGRLHPDLYMLLRDHFFDALRHSIVTSVRRIPEIDRVRVGTSRYSSAVDLHAAYVANAFAGVIESAIEHPSVTTEFALDVVVASLPRWMLEAPTRSST